MNLDMCIVRFSHKAATITNLVQDVSAEQAQWKPSADDWSILEVINHLYDEEREDFRQRLDFLLFQPEAELPPIDPDGWVTSRHYNERDLATSVTNFLQEREQSTSIFSVSTTQSDTQVNLRVKASFASRYASSRSGA
jgi:hypothetical protein